MENDNAYRISFSIFHYNSTFNTIRRIMFLQDDLTTKPDL